MITLKFPIQLSEEDAKFIKELQIAQSSMIRTAYKQASYGCAEISVRAEIRTRFKDQLDSWFQQSAVKCGIGMFRADYETDRTSRVFGGVKNLVRRSKGLISNEEWKELRLNPVYLIGESPAKGNRKFSFGADSVLFKPWQGKQVLISLPKMRKNWSKLWQSAITLANSKSLPITVSLTSQHICLSFDDSKVKKSIKPIAKPLANRYAGIDLNPNYIGISIFDGNKIVETKLFSLKSLTGKRASADKLQHETREIGHAICRWLQHMRVKTLFIEQLNFKSGSIGKGKNLNRLCKNQWKKATLKAVLSKYFKLYEINAAYSSTIGNVLNPTLPDPIAASCEIARRGYEVVIQKSKKFYPELPSKGYLEDLWKETEIPMVSSWKELHDWLKKAKLKYRVPLPSEESFRIFQSPTSLVGVL